MDLHLALETISILIVAIRARQGGRLCRHFSIRRRTLAAKVANLEAEVIAQLLAKITRRLISITSPSRG